MRPRPGTLLGQGADGLQVFEIDAQIAALRGLDGVGATMALLLCASVEKF